jgi:hypothetical protein
MVKVHDASTYEQVHTVDTGHAATRVAVHDGLVYVGVEGVGVVVYSLDTMQQSHVLDTEKGESRGLFIVGGLRSNRSANFMYIFLD